MKQEAFKKISQVAQEIGVEQHVLRFWEQEFSVINPLKRRGRRLYSTNDIEVIKKIKDLLYNQGYTIKGVKKLLRTKEISEDKYKDGIQRCLSSLEEIYNLIQDKYGM